MITAGYCHAPGVDAESVNGSYISLSGGALK